MLKMKMRWPKNEMKKPQRVSLRRLKMKRWWSIEADKVSLMQQTPYYAEGKALNFYFALALHFECLKFQ
ncbi:hypothetical protein CUMW_253260 [Citrus unshiu]|uniref:Uncharacterized protein n=1 Tax=Citrus unshiu TaxID=55188 RepID=A0A2H5QQV7_CITUN|nr:hypothetical protein CUMW_253260 [Citrus unshiu]